MPEWAAWAEAVLRVVWIAIAFGVGRGMGHRGHDRGWWFLVGLLLGPVAILAAVRSARRAAGRAPIVLAPGSPGPGEFDVLVVIDQDEPAAALGTSSADPAGLGRLILVAVVGRDTFDVDARAWELRRAGDALAAAAAAVPTGIDPARVMVEGRPDEAVAAYAVSTGATAVLVAPTPPGRELAGRLSSTLGTPVSAVGLAALARLASSQGQRRSA